MEQTFFIPELPPMLNGSGGLQQMHWSKYQKIKKSWVWLVKAVKPKKHSGQVRVTFVRHSSNVADPDNVAASFKVVGDALVANGVLTDDNFKVIVEFVVRWQKVARKDQGISLKIEDVS